MFARLLQLQTKEADIRTCEEHASYALHYHRDKGRSRRRCSEKRVRPDICVPQEFAAMSRIEFEKHIRQPLAGVRPGCEVRYLKMDVSTLFGVAGRVALVTGGSSGLGLMIAKVLSLSP